MHKSLEERRKEVVEKIEKLQSQLKDIDKKIEEKKRKETSKLLDQTAKIIQKMGFSNPEDIQGLLKSIKENSEKKTEQQPSEQQPLNNTNTYTSQKDDNG